MCLTRPERYAGDYRAGIVVTILWRFLDLSRAAAGAARRGQELFQQSCCIALALLPATVLADWTDWLDVLKDKATTSEAVAQLSQSEIADGLREALAQGVGRAVDHLGQPDGFLANTNVRIPMPEHLGLVESGLRKIGQDELADDFVNSMNHAAERAVPEAATVFADAISQMTLEDAKAILDGSDTAATEYLQRTSNEQLRERFSPIVESAMGRVGVTKAYQDLIGKADFVGGLLAVDKLDLNNYVTDKALGGVYYMVGEEERKIRENPAARTTELLKRVFGN